MADGSHVSDERGLSQFRITGGIDRIAGCHQQDVTRGPSLRRQEAEWYYINDGSLDIAWFQLLGYRK